MKYFIKQIGDKDCGFTCVKMLLAIYYKNEDYLYYPVPQIETASSLKDLMMFAKKEGMIISASRISNKNEFYKYETKKAFLTPIKDDKFLHMILIKKVYKNKILVYDPAIGIYKMSKKEFLSKWNGEVLEVSKIGLGNYKKEAINVIPRPLMYLTFVFQILSFSSLVVATLFIDKNYSFLIPLLLFFAYIIFEFLYQKSIIMSLKYFDSTILVNDFSFKRNNFRKYYEPMNKFKYSLISSPLQLVNSVLILMFGVFILGINNLYNLLILLTIFLVQILFKLYEKVKINKKIENLEKIERRISFDYDLSDDDFKKYINELNYETYQVVSFFNFKKYFLMFLTIALCLLYQGFSGEISINFMLFHFFMYIYLEENFNKLLNATKLMLDIKYYKCLYLYYFH